MAEQMNVVTYDDAGIVVGLSRVKRLAEHTDLRQGVVHEDNAGTLTVEPIVLGQPSRTRETWTPVEVATAFLPPDQQAGQTPAAIPQEVVTELTAREIRDKGIKYKSGGAARWQHDPGNPPSERADARRTVRVTPLGLRADVGDARPDVTFTMLAGRDPDLTFNGNLDLVLTVRKEDQRLTLTFVNGIATMPVKTTFALDTTVSSTSEFKVEEDVPIRVFDNAIG